MLVATLALALVASSVAGARGPGRLPGIPAFAVCAAAGPYWPTETLAVAGTAAWVACKEQGRVIRVDLARRTVTRSVALGTTVSAIAVGYGSLWALDSTGTLSRLSLSSGRLVKRIDTAAGNAYNVFVGAGSVWVLGDSSAEAVRISPVANRVVARIRVGDGPADMVFQGASAWVVDHRDLTLYRIDTRTNAVRLLATLGADAPERLALLGGSLWVTGRGTDLLRVDPATGATVSVAEIGASGIDVVAAAGALWVPVRNAVVDQSGFPTMEALRRVSADGRVATVARATGRVDVHGLVAASGAVWLADNTAGLLYRVPIR